MVIHVCGRCNYDGWQLTVWISVTYTNTVRVGYRRLQPVTPKQWNCTVYVLYRHHICVAAGLEDRTLYGTSRTRFPKLPWILRIRRILKWSKCHAVLCRRSAVLRTTATSTDPHIYLVPRNLPRLLRLCHGCLCKSAAHLDLHWSRARQPSLVTEEAYRQTAPLRNSTSSGEWYCYPVGLYTITTTTIKLT